MKPLIGLTCGTEVISGREYLADRLAQTYTQAVVTAGGLPVILPNVPTEDVGSFLDRLDGLVLTGGRDVEPRLYGAVETHPAVELDETRDRFELQLIRLAFERGMPVLGICRGIQALNVALGGTLFQDLPSERPSPIPHRQQAERHVATHRLTLSHGSLAARALGTTELAVNTFHHQAVKECAPPMLVSGHAEDGLIEAVEAPDTRFVLGVQYHPEEMVAVCAHSRRLFASFIEAAADYARK